MYYRNIFIGAGVTLKVTEGRAFQKPILKGTDVANLNHIQGEKYLLKQNRMLAIEDVLHFFLSLSLIHTSTQNTLPTPANCIITDCNFLIIQCITQMQNSISELYGNALLYNEIDNGKSIPKQDCVPNEYKNKVIAPKATFSRHPIALASMWLLKYAACLPSIITTDNNSRRGKYSKSEIFLGLWTKTLSAIRRYIHICSKPM